MKEFLIGVLIFCVGFFTGSMWNHRDPPNFATEIKNLQQDIMRIEGHQTENFIKIEYLERWRDEIIFRPPLKKKEK